LHGNTFDDEDDDDDEILDECLRLGNVSQEEKLRLRELLRISMKFDVFEDFVWKDDHYVLELGLTYPDDSLMRFKLYYKEDDKTVLSDCGLTYKAMSKYFNFDEENVAKRIQSILDEYSLRMEKDGDSREIYVKIVDSESAFFTFLWFFVSIEKIVNLKSEHLLYTLTQDLDHFCKDEIYRVFFQDRATYEEAKATFNQRLSNATAENDGFKISGYKMLLSILEDITEDAYKEFVEYVLEGLTLRLNDFEDDEFDEADFDEVDFDEVEFDEVDFDEVDFDEDDSGNKPC
jgi:hypothetical protein